MKKLLFIVFAMILTACGEDNSEQLLHESFLKQGWKLSSVSINDVETDISSVALPELMYLTDQQLCYLALPVNNGADWIYSDVRTAWSYDYSNKILNVAASLPVTYYVDRIEGAYLELHYYTYNSGGGIDLYKKVFQPVDVEVKNLTIRLIE